MDSKFVGLYISGLAYNPYTQHLFVMTNSFVSQDLYVLDGPQDYKVVGGFNVEGFSGYDQAGLEIDCNGHLWALNQATQSVFEIDSGESGVCEWMEVPWLSEEPLSGSLSAGGTQPVTLTLDTTGLAVGTYQAHLRIGEDTTYNVAAIPVTLQVIAGADLTLDLVADPDPAIAGSDLLYTITVTNQGPFLAEDVLVEDTLPDGVSLVSVSSSQGACTSLPCNVGTLANAGEATVTILVNVDVGLLGTLTNTAEVSASTTDPDLENNSATLETIVPPGIFLPMVYKQ